MGNCCSSSPQDETHAPAPVISRPTDIMLNVPRPQLDAYGRPLRVQDYELDRETLFAALTTMANYIDSQRQSITVITVGGAVNTLLLRNRRSTHDVDFFGTNLNNDQRILLNDAAKYAERHSSTPLGGEWFNNQTVLWLPPDVHRRVTAESLQLNEVVFEKRGLKVIAAPWNYAMCGKMNRLVRDRSEHRPYDLSDAASYLHHWIRRNPGGPVSVATVKQWCQHYHKKTSDEVIRAVGAEYKRQYKRDGIAQRGR